MKKALLPLALILSAYVMGQPYQHEKLSYIDADGQPTKEKKAVMMQQLVQLNDTLWETNVYRMDGPRLVSVQSAEAYGTDKNGYYITYRPDGWADTVGSYDHGKRSGIWGLYSGKLFVGEQYYEKGVMIWQKDTVQAKQWWDSVRATWKKPGDTVQIESSFPGGGKGWLHYLNKNLKYPDDAFKKRIMGQVVVGFIVNAEGNVSPTSLYLAESVAYSLDKESLRVIYGSGQWVAAIQYGKPVKSYKKQPIVFKF